MEEERQLADLLDDVNLEDETQEDESQAGGEVGGEGEPPDIDKQIKERMNKYFEEVAEAIARGDADTPLYKGLQRVISKKDREINALKQQLQAYTSQIAVLQKQMELLGATSNALASSLYENLDDQSKSKLAQAINSIREQALSAMAQQQQPVVSSHGRQPPVYQEEQEEDGEDLEELFRKLETEFVEGRKAFARKFGVDPNDKRLDYGSPGEPLTKRLAKFEESLEKILQERRKKVSSGPRIPTNTGGTIEIPGGGDMLSLGADEILRELRKKFV
ncbi:MAG: hypothetical protein QXI19_06460 [Candidatus Caldarchaeum sp.]